MWALVENGEVTKILRYELNVVVHDTIIGNIAVLSDEERKEKRIYKVIEAADVDKRFYAATYTRYKIDHDRGQVLQINEIKPQPIERIIKYRLEELKEIRDRKLKGPYVLKYQCIGNQCSTMEVNITDTLVSRLALTMSALINGGSSGLLYVDDVDGETHSLKTYEFERLAKGVSIHIERCHYASATIKSILQDWKEGDEDRLIEYDLEEKFEETLDLD